MLTKKKKKKRLIITQYWWALFSDLFYCSDVLYITKFYVNHIEWHLCVSFMYEFLSLKTNVLEWCLFFVLYHGCVTFICLCTSNSYVIRSIIATLCIILCAVTHFIICAVNYICSHIYVNLWATKQIIAAHARCVGTTLTSLTVSTMKKINLNKQFHLQSQLELLLLISLWLYPQRIKEKVLQVTGNKNLKEIKEKEKIELVREAAKKKKNDAIEAFIKCRDEFNCWQKRSASLGLNQCSVCKNVLCSICSKTMSKTDCAQPLILPAKHNAN